MAHANLKLACEKLSPNNIASGLPGRETQGDEIYTFLYERLKVRKTLAEKRAKVQSGAVANIVSKHSNGIMFICGVPGTGKTATVLSVTNRLQKWQKNNPGSINDFNVIYVNGQHISSPEKIYSEILYKITKKVHSSEKAQDLLDQIFNSANGICKPHDKRRKSSKAQTLRNDCFQIIVIDELDLLYNDKRQDIFYSLFDWPTSSNSKVLLIAIANAFDMSERFTQGRVSSRMGLNRLVFEPYTSDCLETILEARLGQDLMNKCFEKNAVILATKRIGRANGDARRILDTCRLAINKTIEKKLSKVTSAIIDEVGFQNKDINRRNYINTCPPTELMALKCILIETAKVGEENVEAYGVYKQLVHMMAKSGLFRPDDVLGIDGYHDLLSSLAAVGMIYLESDKHILKKKLCVKGDNTLNDQIRTNSVASQ